MLFGGLFSTEKRQVMNAALDWISGISWSLVYVIAIIIGIRKKALGIPAVNICLNICWESCVVIARVIGRSEFDSGFISQLLWLGLDIGLLCVFFKHANWLPVLKKLVYLGGAAISMVLCTWMLGLWAETAFAINLIMSIFFLWSNHKRVFSSLTIAVLKFVGTLSATILNGIIHQDYIIVALGGLCFIADICYIIETVKCLRITELCEHE